MRNAPQKNSFVSRRVTRSARERRRNVAAAFPSAPTSTDGTTSRELCEKGKKTKRAACGLSANTSVETREAGNGAQVAFRCQVRPQKIKIKFLKIPNHRVLYFQESINTLRKQHNRVADLKERHLCVQLNEARIPQGENKYFFSHRIQGTHISELIKTKYCPWIMS